MTDRTHRLSARATACAFVRTTRRPAFLRTLSKNVTALPRSIRAQGSRILREWPASYLSKLTISTQFEPLPVGYFCSSVSAPLAPIA